MDSVSLERRDEAATAEPRKKSKGLGTLTAAVFIAGEMAGSGVLALPRAVVDSGWIGLVLIVYFCINAGYGGTRLGVCWAILEERYPEYRNPVRNPYATIAYRAVGKWGRVVGVGAILTTAFACIFIFAQIVIDGSNSTLPVKHEVHGFSSFFLAFGSILFAFGGASTFPTIQNDMVQKDKFSVSVIIGFSVILALYLPVATAGYFVYGEAVHPNIVLTLQNSIWVMLANILLAIHLVLAFLIVINPVCQELEEICHVPHEFNWKRCLIRTGMMCIMIFIGESIPKFGKILSLVGGSSITLLTFVLPSLFYMRLCDQEKQVNWPERNIPAYIRIYLWELILIGLIGGTASTYNAILEIFKTNSITKPCYLQ
ncbi:hypothetical protein C0J52_16728 [Blattella germanica]|nr:hypothetical protein C0J52_16728 [Blattella germanica]